MTSQTTPDVTTIRQAAEIDAARDYASADEPWTADDIDQYDIPDWDAVCAEHGWDADHTDADAYTAALRDELRIILESDADYRAIMGCGASWSRTAP